MHDTHVDGDAGLDVCRATPEGMPTTPNGELIVLASARSDPMDEILNLRSSGRSEDTAGAQLAFGVAVVGCDGRIVRCTSGVVDGSWDLGVDDLAAIVLWCSGHYGWQCCYNELQDRPVHGSLKRPCSRAYRFAIAEVKARKTIGDLIGREKMRRTRQVEIRRYTSTKLNESC